jgi:SAM-dependent methyltransferase
MNRFVEANRRHWDEAVPLHVAGPFYDVPAFKAGACTLKRLELDEVGDVREKSLLHLQCHFGLDTLSWARRGARVTGLDFSAPAIEAARRLAREVSLDAEFVVADVLHPPSSLDGEFDVVFTSYGVLSWLPDLRRWAEVAARFVRPGGFLYVAEFHPFSWIFDDRPGTTELRVRYPYFGAPEPIRFEEQGTYAAKGAVLAHAETFWFPFTLGDVVTSVVAAGLRVEFLHEHPSSGHCCWPYAKVGADGAARLVEHDGSVPLVFSLKATRPA